MYKRTITRPAAVLTALFCLAALAGCGASAPPDAYSDTAPHTAGYVTVADNVRLHYLDFGGTGETLLFLAGNGNSAHIYDTFAPRFTGSFHVLALTRRGFGESGQPQTGYDQDTLAGDILQFLDSQKIDKVIIAGHSIAGVEMTRFAVLHPERVDKLIYLDAAYDWAAQYALTNLPPAPAYPQPAAADVRSPAAFTAWEAKILGVPAYPEADIRATSVFKSGGEYRKSVTPDTISAAFSQAMAAVHPDYAAVKAPALVIFTVPDSPQVMFPWLTADSPDQAQAGAYFNAISAVFQAHRDDIRREMPQAAVLEMDTVHFLFLSQPDAVEQDMRSFLGL